MTAKNEAVVKVRGLGKRFSQGNASIWALKNIDLTVAAGETLAILGPSGSGKSTMLSLLAGLDAPTEGEIFVAGQDLGQLSEENLTSFRAEHVGIVFQQFHLLPHLTALENVSLPLELQGRPSSGARPNATEAAAELLRLTGLGDRLNHFPGQLSGGECQRVAIARALITSPDLLLADEPSGSLDTATGLQVMDLLFRLVQEKKRTLILITHDAQLAKRCDRSLLLSGGQARVAL